MKKFFVYFPIEIISRELHSRLLIAKALLMNSDVAVVLGPRNLLSKAGDTLPSGVLLFKDLVDRADQFKLVYNRGNKIAIINEEGLVYPTAEAYIERRFDALAWGMIGRYYSWGEKETQDIRTHLGDPRNVILTAGNPRIDILRDKSLLQSGLVKSPGYVQINSTLGHVNPVTKKARKKQIAAAEKNSAHVWKSYHDESRQLFIFYEELIHCLGKQNKFQVVYRPHPEENRNYWQPIIKKYKNVTMKSSLSAVEWMSQSSMVIHNNCTTALEAYAMGVPTICLGPKKRGGHDSLANDLSLHADDVSECMTLIDALYKNPHIADALHQPLLEKSFIDKCRSYKKWDSYEIIAEDLISMCEKKSTFSVSKFESSVKGFSSKLKKDINLWFSRPHSSTQKFPGLDGKSLDAAISLIDRYDSKLPSLKSAEKYCIGKDTWLITRD